MKRLIVLLSPICFFIACNTKDNREAEALKASKTTIDSLKAVLVKKAIIDSMNTIITHRQENVATGHEDKSSNIVANNPAAPAVTKKKTRWNHTAKGAVVGAGTGAVTGAILNKKHAEGAIVGSLIGAGIGAGTGALVDHSKKKKKRSN